MEATVFNPAQLHLLRLFSYVRDEKSLREIRDVLSSHFAKKVDEEMDRLWDEGTISPETIESWRKEHLRTPYK